MNIALVWFRNDLRLVENPAFIDACNNHDVVIPLYVFDKTTSVLGRAQRWWLHHSLSMLNDSLTKYGLNLVLRKGEALEILTSLAQEFSIKTVYWNRCYEPFSIKRDKHIKSTMLNHGVEVKSSNGSLLAEPWTIKNKQGEYFKVFTPFWKHCLRNITIPNSVGVCNRPQSLEVATDKLDAWHLLPKHPNWAKKFSDYWQPGEEGARNKLYAFIHSLNEYKTNRNFPAKHGTSLLSPHLHFGEISPWTIWRVIEDTSLEKACDLVSAEHFLSELGWREFSYHLLYHFPSLPHQNFKKEFDAFPWHNDKFLLERWQQGTTGYPLIDAGMRELWTTGYMHNRIRMIVASFLTKDLFIDWRVGAEWFLDTLVDADLANNSASWQWVTGSGVDAVPYFRIFNPIVQSKTFDPHGEYIRAWVPELASINSAFIHHPWTANDAKLGIQLGKDYPTPIIDHDQARKKALHYYKGLKNP